MICSVGSYPCLRRDTSHWENNSQVLKGEGWLMCYVAAQGKTYGEIFDVRTKQDIRSKIAQWHALRLGWYTDQLMLKKYLLSWPNLKTRCTLLHHTVEKRVDRARWAYEPKKVTQGNYIDSHLPRPYTKYKKYIDDLVRLLPSCEKTQQKE